MKILLLVIASFIFTINLLYAQTYKNEDTTLSIFKINDTLKYFEFYTPNYPHSNVGCGVLAKTKQNVFTLRYADAPNYSNFKIEFNNNIHIERISEVGYIPYSLERNKDKMKITCDSPIQYVSQFHLNFPTFYKAKNTGSIKVYEYPSFESKTKLIDFKKGSEIEEKWSVGIYDKYMPIKTKTWIAAVCGNKFIGWLLLSDVEANFEKQDE